MIFLQIYIKFPNWENVVQIRIDEAIWTERSTYFRRKISELIGLQGWSCKIQFDFLNLLLCIDALIFDAKTDKYEFTIYSR